MTDSPTPAARPRKPKASPTAPTAPAAGSAARAAAPSSAVAAPGATRAAAPSSSASAAAPAVAAPVGAPSVAEQLLAIDVSAVPGFFRALVDFRFTTFITRRIAGFIYAILLVSIVLAGLVAFFSIVVTGVGLMTGGQPISGVLTVLGALVLVPVATLVTVVLARMIVEVNVALVAIAENTSGLRRP